MSFVMECHWPVKHSLVPETLNLLNIWLVLVSSGLKLERKLCTVLEQQPQNRLNSAPDCCSWAGVL